MKSGCILALFFVASFGVFIYAGGHIIALSSSNQVKGLELFSLIFGLLVFIAILAFATIQMYPIYVKEYTASIKNPSIDDILKKLKIVQDNCDASIKQIETMTNEIRNLAVSRAEKESVLKYLLMEDDSPKFKEEYRKHLLETFDIKISSSLDQGKEETSESK